VEMGRVRRKVDEIEGLMSERSESGLLAGR
jgi:hypothetical protein